MKTAHKHPVQETGSGSLPTLPLHRNAGLEVVIVVRGSVRWQTEKRVEEVGAGSVFFTFPWEAHGSVDEFERGHFWQYAIFQVGEIRSGRNKSISFPDTFGFSRSEAKGIAGALLRAPHRSWKAGSFLRELMDELILETQNRPAKSAAGKVCALSRLIIAELSRIVVQSERNAGTPIGTQSVAQFLKILAERCDESWTLEKMAEKSGYQRTHLANQIKQLTGDSPTQHLKRLRIERARSLLRTTDQNITEIAHQCGFMTSQHFARIFRQFTFMSASDYREQARLPM